jgi:DNA-binding XRE family transcriptional regulator
MYINLDHFMFLFYIMNVMAQKKLVLLPVLERKLETMGEQIKLARLRRKLPVSLVAERANISRSTLWAIEKGSPSVSMGAYAAVLLALNMADDLLLIAKDDVLGRTLQDLNLPTGKRAPRRSHE